MSVWASNLKSRTCVSSFVRWDVITFPGNVFSPLFCFELTQCWFLFLPPVFLSSGIVISSFIPYLILPGICLSLAQAPTGSIMSSELAWLFLWRFYVCIYAGMWSTQDSSQSVVESSAARLLFHLPHCLIDVSHMPGGNPEHTFFFFPCFRYLGDKMTFLFFLWRFFTLLPYHLKSYKSLIL